MTDSAEKTLDPQTVTDYLLANPDFFLNKTELLNEINFPHETNGAISLIERQVQLLREAQKASKALVTELTANANANHELLKKMQSLTLDLMQALDAAELLTSLDAQMRGHFSLDQVQLLMDGSDLGKGLSHNQLPFTQECDSTAMSQMHADIFNLNVYVGRVPAKLNQYFSADSLDICKSIALIKLEDRVGKDSHSAYLLLGSAQEERFQSDMATDFIEYVGKVISLLLSNLLAQASKPAKTKASSDSKPKSSASAKGSE